MRSEHDKRQFTARRTLLQVKEGGSRIGTYLRTSYMTTVSYTDFRKHLAYFLTMTDEDCEEIIVTRGKGRKAVVLPLDEFLSLQETAYLLSSKKNRKHLEQSLKEAKKGNIVFVDL